MVNYNALPAGSWRCADFDPVSNEDLSCRSDIDANQEGNKATLRFGSCQHRRGLLLMPTLGRFVRNGLAYADVRE